VKKINVTTFYCSNENKIKINIKDSSLINENFTFSNTEQKVIEVDEETEVTQFHIKLVLVEIANTKKKKLKKYLLNSTLNKTGLLNKIMPYGWFHTALIVGPWYLEWNSSSLCIPKKISSTSAFMVLDIDKEFTRKEFNEGIENLITEIAYWNNNLYYDNVKANCQKFVHHLCKCLSIDLTKNQIFEPRIREYLKIIKYSGSSTMVWKFPHRLKPVIKEYLVKNDDDHIVIKSHQQLDSIVKSLLVPDNEINPDFKNMFHEGTYNFKNRIYFAQII
jgi:hypothetical protein